MNSEIINKQIELIIAALKMYQDAGYIAFIAGGWLRDLDYGILPKDIDIFVIPQNRLSYDEVKYIAYSIHTGSYVDSSDKRVCINYNDEDSVMRDDVDRVYIMNGVDVILMNPNTPIGVCQNFDVSICQIYATLDPHNSDELRVYASQAYTETYVNNVLYRYTDIPTCDSHIQRLRTKFPDMSVVDVLSKPQVYHDQGILNKFPE